MQVCTRRGLGLCVALLSLAACHVDGKASADGTGPVAAEGATARCAAGDRSAGDELIASARATSSLDARRGSLREACDAGCAPTCLELARVSLDRPSVEAAHESACKLGDSIGCSLAGELDLATAAQTCDAGEVHACIAAVRLGAGQEGREQLDRRVVEASASACEQGDARACSVHAWTRCAGLGECDAAAIAAAETAATRLPEPELVEALAVVQCHAGEGEAANAGLAAACSAGVEDACGRRCEPVLETAMLVREAERDRYDRIAMFMLLQIDATPAWSVAISAMDSDELAGFEAILDAFTPPISEPAAKLEVPAGLREQFPALVESIIRSPQLDAKQIRYWFKRLPDMTDEQRTNLLDSLRRQWWIIPGEPGRTPQAFVDRVRTSNGGFGAG